MSATSVEIDTKLINNPAYGPPTAQDYARVNTTLSYYKLLSSNIRTLSTNGASVSASPEGLLYVPHLDPSSTCLNISAQYVPENVTRANDLPGPNPAVMAFAPWINANCTRDYLAAAKRDVARSFVFYLPNQPDGEPPVANDPAWNLNDGGQWKGNNPYPVYAIPSPLGGEVIQQLNLYSGNMSSVPNGNILVQNYDPNDYIRLYMDINLSITSGLPSLWIFLVIILAILVTVVGIVSFIMHFVQRRRRASLRRRVANGEVDLEVLGVKRLMVPQEVLDKMPIYVYEKVGGPDPVASTDSVNSPAKSPPVSPKPNSKDRTGSEKISNAAKRNPNTVPLNHFDQPTCAICLDDFVPNESQVRQLPCEHIFHPECVDTFLTQTSSLCPLCKKSALPAGYCPDMITNAMVRRERIIRRARQRAAQLGMEEGEAQGIIAHHRIARLRRIFGGPGDPMEMSVRTSQQPRPAAVAPTSDGDEAVRPVARSSGDRRERARARAEAMVGPDAAPRDPETAPTEGAAWKRSLRRVFPALR